MQSVWMLSILFSFPWNSQVTPVLWGTEYRSPLVPVKEERALSAQPWNNAEKNVEKQDWDKLEQPVFQRV